MRKLLVSMAALSILLTPTAAWSNFLVELSFQQKLAESDIVLVGTIIAVVPGERGKYNGFARVRPLQMLKGRAEPEFIVLTQSRIAEEGPLPVEIGSTYMMFLRRTTDGATLASVNGPFGSIRVGPAHNEPEVRVLKSSP